MIPKTKLPIVVILAAAIVVIALVLFLVPAVQHKGKVHLKVVVVPSDSTLTVDGKKTGAGDIYVLPGKHTLKAERQYFDPVTKDIDTAKISTKETIYMMPKPNSQQAKDWLENHPQEQQKRENAASTEVSKLQNELSKYPIISKLPYSAAGLEYIIDYDTKTNSSGDTQLIIIIRANTDEAQKGARQWLSDNGADPTKLTIEYQSNILQDNPNVGHQ